MSYKEKTSEFFSENYPATGNSITLYLHSKTQIDRVRVSFSYNNFDADGTAGSCILVWSSINNDYIGTIATDAVAFSAGNVTTQSTHEPQQGIDIFFGRKFILQGSYVFKFFYPTGNAVAAADVTNGIVNILVEYFND